MGEFEKNKYVFSSMSTMIDISDIAERSREKLISLMLKELFLYKVLIKDLTSHKPNNLDRNLILNIAYYVLENIEILEKFQKKRELPFNRIVNETKVTKVYLEIWQDYIVAYIVILSNPNYKSVQDYLRIEYKSNNNENKTEGLCKGIIMEENKKSNIILNSKGEFIKIKKSDTAKVGKEVEGIEKKGSKNIKIKLAIVAVLLILISFGGYREYTKVVRTVIIGSSSQIKLETNRFDDVIYAYADAEKGKELIESISPIDKDIDEVLQKSIEFIYENKMISTEEILVTITDEPIKYGKLKLTGEYIVLKNIRVLVNNAGNEQKLYESTIKQKDDNNEKNGE